MRRFGLLLVMVVALALAALPVSAASSTWKLYSFNNSGYALRSEVAKFAGGSVSVGLPTSTWTGAAYLMSTKIPSSGALSATVSISADADTVVTNWPGCRDNVDDARVGLYFEFKGKGRFNPSDYWWSSQRVLLNSIVNGSTSLSTALADAGSWTNFYGKPGTMSTSYEVDGVTYPAPSAGFANAVAKMSAWGVSFGGDCYYANGVAASNSSAIFTLVP